MRTTDFHQKKTKKQIIKNKKTRDGVAVEKIKKLFTS